MLTPLETFTDAPADAPADSPADPPADSPAGTPDERASAAPPDRVLLEHTGVRRSRLLAAFVHGAQDSRSRPPEDLRRFVAGLVLAAAGAAGCVGYAVVADALAHQGLR